MSRLSKIAERIGTVGGTPASAEQTDQSLLERFKTRLTRAPRDDLEQKAERGGRLSQLIRELQQRRDYFGRKNELRCATESFFVLNELDTKLYLEAMNSLGFNSEGLKTADLSIDRKGYCPVFAEKYGKDYLSDKIVIVSPNQISAPIAARRFSFDDLVAGEIYCKANNLITNITLKEALIFSLQYSKKCETPKDIKDIRFVQAVPETALGLIELKKSIEREVKELYERPNRFLDDIILGKIIEKIAKLEPRYGNLMNLTIDYFSIPIVTRLDSFVEYNSSTYVLRTREKTYVVNSTIDTKGADHEMVPISSTERVFSILHENGFCQLHPKRIEQKILENIAEVFFNNGLLFYRMNDVAIKQAGEQLAEQIYGKTRPLHDLLDEVNSTGKEIIDTESFVKMDIQTKISLLRIQYDKPVVGHLIAGITRNPVLCYKYNDGVFKEIFSSANEKRKELILAYVTNSLEYEQEQNQQVNSWLANNYRENCEKAGINCI